MFSARPMISSEVTSTNDISTVAVPVFRRFRSRIPAPAVNASKGPLEFVSDQNRNKWRRTQPRRTAEDASAPSSAGVHTFRQYKESCQCGVTTGANRVDGEPVKSTFKHRGFQAYD